MLLFRVMRRRAMSSLSYKSHIRAVTCLLSCFLFRECCQQDCSAIVQQFQKQQAPISETVKLVSLEKTAQNIKRETVIEERDQETGEIIEYRKLFALRM